MAGSRRLHPIAIQHFTRATIHTTLVEDGKDRYASKAGKGRLHYPKGVSADLAPPDYQ
jgi:hypothetical protein